MEPPPWDQRDSMERYFADAEVNVRATAATYPEVFALLKGVHRALERAEGILGGDGGTHFAIARMLFVRAHSAYLAACRLAMGAQPVESAAVSRVVIELTWYGLHIALDPAPPRRLKVWLSRGDSAQADKKCKDEFKINNVRPTHEKLDPAGARDLHGVYERSIDFGAHPNQLGLMTAIKGVHEGDGERTYQVGILYGAPLVIAFSLQLATAAALGLLVAFQHLRKERFKLADLDREIGGLIERLNTVFKPFRT